MTNMTDMGNGKRSCVLPPMRSPLLYYRSKFNIQKQAVTHYAWVKYLLWTQLYQTPLGQMHVACGQKCWHTNNVGSLIGTLIKHWWSLNDLAVVPSRTHACTVVICCNCLTTKLYSQSNFWDVHVNMAVSALWIGDSTTLYHPNGLLKASCVQCYKAIQS